MEGVAVKCKTLLAWLFFLCATVGALGWSDKPGISKGEKESPNLKPFTGKNRLDLFGDPLPPEAVARLGTVRLRHRSTIRYLAYSGDGKVLATASISSVLVGSRQKSLKEVTALAFSRNKRVLAIAERDFANFTNRIQFWDLTTGRLESRNFPEKDCYIVSLAYSPDETILAGAVQRGDEGQVRLWNMTNGESRILCRFQHFSGIWNIAFAADGKSLACPGENDTVCIVDLAAGKIVHRCKGHENEVTAVALTPDGKTLISGSNDQTIRFWDPSNGKEKRCLEGHEGYVINLNLSSDGTELASQDSHGWVRIWETATGKELVSCRRSGEGGMALAPGGKVLALANRHKTVDFWEVPSGREQARLPGHVDTVVSLAFSADGAKLASAAKDDTVRIWDPLTMKLLHQYQEQANVVTFSPDQKLLIGDGKNHFWFPGERPRKKALQENKMPAVPIDTKVWSPDGRMQALVREDGSVRLVETASGKERRRFQGHLDKVTAAAFSKNGKFLASGSADTTILIWSVYGAPSGPIDKKKLNSLWEDLAHQDATVAFTAVCALIHAPEQAIPFLKKQLQSVPLMPEARLHQLIADLESDRFLVRKNAVAEIQEALETGKLSPTTFEKGMKKKLSSGASLELSRRGQQLLKNLASLEKSPRRLRLGRVQEVLQHARADRKPKS
jgi:WD40 repeat protein